MTRGVRNACTSDLATSASARHATGLAPRFVWSRLVRYEDCGRWWRSVCGGLEILVSAPRRPWQGQPMRVAFHFDETDVSDSSGLTPLEEEVVTVVRALIESIPRHRGHVRIRAGLGGVSWHRKFSRDEQAQLEEELWQPLDCWSSFATGYDLVVALHSGLTSVILVEGIAREDAAAVHKVLLAMPGYLGSMQVRRDHAVQASYYSLPLSLRLHGANVGVLMPMSEDPAIAGEDGRDHGRLEALRALLFPLGIHRVEFEYTGLQDTMFDPASSLDVDAEMGRAERLLETYIGGVVDEVMIRARDLDPEFVTVLAAALRALEEHVDSEQLAHVSLSCRRALTRLADMLYPARRSKKGERSLGPEAYRNRLWAYAEERLKSDSKVGVVLATLSDVGARIEALDAVANKGLHDQVDAQEVRRLVLGLLVLVHDLLTLAAPSGAPASAYEQAILGQMEPYLRKDLGP